MLSSVFVVCDEEGVLRLSRWLYASSKVSRLYVCRDIGTDRALLMNAFEP